MASRYAPWNTTEEQQVATTGALNVSFSQDGWANAQQSGCALPPGVKFPKWPESNRLGYQLPALDKIAQSQSALMSQFQHPFASSPEQDNVVTPNLQPATSPLGALNPLAYDAAFASSLQRLQQLHSCDQNDLYPAANANSVTTECGCSGSKPSEATSCKIKTLESLKKVPACTWDAWKTTVGDLLHLDKIPGANIGDKLYGILAKRDAGLYIAGSVVVALIVAHALKRK